MALPDKAVAEFKQIFKDEYRVELSESEVKEAGARLVKFFELLIEIDQRKGK